MPKKILITGGPGFIGHQVVKKFLDKTDYEILIVDRLSYAGNLDRLAEVFAEINEANRSRVELFIMILKLT